MDKANMPLRRKRAHTEAFHVVRKSIKQPMAQRQQKKHREENLGWLKTIFKVFKKVWNYLGFLNRPKPAEKPHTKVDPQHPRWFEARIARNRRRRKLGNISRRINR